MLSLLFFSWYDGCEGGWAVLDDEEDRMFMLLLLLFKVFCCCSSILFSLEFAIVTRSWAFSFNEEEVFVVVISFEDDVVDWLLLLMLHVLNSLPPVVVVLLFSLSESECTSACSLSGTSVVSPSAPTIKRMHFFFLLNEQKNIHCKNGLIF